MIKSTKFQVILKAQLARSFWDAENDHVKIQAVGLSKRHYIWYLVTMDGVKWDLWAHRPSEYMQCVSYIGGKIDECTQGVN